VGDRRWPRVTDWILDNRQELFEDLEGDQVEEHVLLLLEQGKEAALHARQVA
jgi:hypothetical protein